VSFGAPDAVQRLRGFAAGLRLLRDPSRLDDVFEIDAAIPNQHRTYAAIVGGMRAFPHAAAALVERPRMNVDLRALRELPAATLGGAFARFLDANGLDPRAIPTLEDDDERTWARAHLYETHDIWHVATGFGTDIPGELGLMAFYAAQLPVRLPQFLLGGGFLHAALWDPDDFHARLGAAVRGWTAGREAHPLFGVRWDNLWHEPLSTVREQLRLHDSNAIATLDESWTRHSRSGPRSGASV
jgi:ubiquinone biosynthesis protein COQ4